MKARFIVLWIWVLIMLSGGVKSSLAFTYDEAINGDLSDNGLLPNILVPAIGDNILKGTIEYPDDDFFSFSIPVDWRLESIVLLHHNTSSDDTFLGVEDAPVYVTGQGNSNYFGYTFFDLGDVGIDLLPRMGVSNGNFTPPLSFGDYSFWIDESDGLKEYALNFHFVPEPATVYLLGLGGLSLLHRRRRGSLVS